MLSVLVLSALAASPGHGSAVTGPAGCGRHCSGHCTPGLGAVGPALSSANDVPSACACLRLCADDPVAQAWQWVSKKGEHNYRTCYLKGTVDLQPNPVYVSGCMPKGRANATARCPARPPAPPVPPVPPAGDVHFPGSRIILNNATWGAAVNNWAKKPSAQAWHLCYSSLTDTPNTPATFHKQCDPHNITVVFARNSIGYIFGGYAAGPWSKTACCAVSANTCKGTYCIDRTASSDFLFRLQPGEPERFLPKGGTGSAATEYQAVAPSYWPVWGYGFDLTMGDGGPPGGDGGYCGQGTTYVGSPNEACGGGMGTSGGPCTGLGCWGPTDMEVWFLKAARGPEGR